MFKLICLALAFVGVGLLVNLGGANERAEEMRYLAQRTENQDQILIALLTLNDLTVTELVSDWREAYVNPSPANLSELREIEARIKNDKDSAASMTYAYKVKNNPNCSGEIKSVFSVSAPVCKPGI